jgi:hypothetical protein
MNGESCDSKNKSCNIVNDKDRIESFNLSLHKNDIANLYWLYDGNSDYSTGIYYITFFGRYLLGCRLYYLLL